MPSLEYIVLEATVLMFVIGFVLKMFLSLSKRIEQVKAQNDDDHDRIYEEIQGRVGDIEREMMTKEVFEIFRSEVKDMKADLTFIKNFLLQKGHEHTK